MSVEQVNITVPSNPADLADIFKVMKEISNSKTRAKGESDYQKEALSALAEKYGIDKKYLSRMANDYHKHEFDKRANEFDEYSALYEAVMEKGAKAATSTAQSTISDEEE